MNTRVFINDQAYELNGNRVTGSQIKALAQLEAQQLYRVRGDERVEVDDEDAIAVDGDDRFVSVPPSAWAGDERDHRVITIYVDGDPYQTDQRVLDGKQIKALAGKPEGNRLFRLAGEGQRIPVADEEEVPLHDDERFVTLPPVGRAS